MFVFVVMPFAIPELFEDIIKPLLEAEGCTVERGDTHFIQRNIIKDILKQLDRADLIIADLTGQNANVFYELGLAHAFRKPTFMITQDDINSLPFDLKSYRTHQYSFRPKNVDDLKERIKHYVKTFHDGQLSAENPVTDFLPSYQPVVGKEPGELLKEAEEAYYRAEDFQNALILAESALKKWPDHSLLHEIAGNAANWLGKADTAIVHGNVITANEPSNSLGYNILAKAYEQMADWNSAARMLEKAVKLARSDTKFFLYFRLGEVRERLGELESAIEAYDNSDIFADKPENQAIVRKRSKDLRNILNL